MIFATSNFYQGNGQRALWQCDNHHNTTKHNINFYIINNTLQITRNWWLSTAQCISETVLLRRIHTFLLPSEKGVLEPVKTINTYRKNDFDPLLPRKLALYTFYCKLLYCLTATLSDIVWAKSLLAVDLAKYQLKIFAVNIYIFCNTCPATCWWCTHS